MAERHRGVAGVNFPVYKRYDEELTQLRSAIRALCKRFNLVFVFGSNLAGAHGAGAALEAADHFGAEMGVGEGPTGQAYALPTKDEHIETLPPEEIIISVENFLEYAELHPELTFFVTRVGCGLAGLKEEDIAPLFADAPENCILPEGWRHAAE